MNNRKLWTFFAIVIAVLLLNHFFGWSDKLLDQSNLSLLEDMVKSNLPMAVIIYVALTVVGSVVLAVPGVTFAIIAGLLFGPVLGTLCCLTAATLGAMGAFLAGRFFLRDSIKPRIENNGLLKKWLFDESGRNQIFVLMITRLVPLFPFNLQNFAYGITDISFAAYSLGSFIFMLPGTAMYTVGFSGITDSENRLTYILISLVIGIIVIGIGAYLNKRYMQDGPEEKTDDE